MAFATPYIEEGILSYSIGTQWYKLSIESRDWQEWLSKWGRKFRFEDDLLSYTARLERRENKYYWYAYYRYRKILYKVYLGRSQELTSARLRATTIELHRRCTTEEIMKKNISADPTPEMPQIHEHDMVPQTSTGQMADIKIGRKGEHSHMEVETTYPFSSDVAESNALLIAPLQEPLTNRERETLQYLIDGLSNKEIAQQLVLSTGTIKWHLKNLYNKLGVHTRSQAIARARALNL